MGLDVFDFSSIVLRIQAVERLRRRQEGIEGAGDAVRELEILKSCFREYPSLRGNETVN